MGGCWTATETLANTGRYLMLVGVRFEVLKRRDDALWLWGNGNGFTGRVSAGFCCFNSHSHTTTGRSRRPSSIFTRMHSITIVGKQTRAHMLTYL